MGAATVTRRGEPQGNPYLLEIQREIHRVLEASHGRSATVAKGGDPQGNPLVKELDEATVTRRGGPEGNP